MKLLTLDKLPINTEAIIITLNAENSLRRRLLDLGLIRGTKVKPLFISPSGDPTAFEFRGSLIALRKSDANLIKVSLI